MTFAASPPPRVAAPVENADAELEAGIAIPLSGSDIGALAILSGTLTVVVALASREESLLVALVIGAISLNALMIGRAIVSAASELPRTLRAVSEIAVGVAVLSLLILGTCLLFQVSAGTAFLVSWIFGVIAFAHNCRRRRNQVWKTRDLVVLFAICAISVVWSWQAIKAMPVLEATGHFRVWSDYFLQADEISWFARLPTVAMKELAIYHYTSLMLPAVVRSLCPIVTAMVAATALWTTLGTIVTGLGTYALGSTLAGRPGGIAAIAAVLLIPDAAHFGFRNALFDFHWFEQIATGSSYATGLACAALAFGVVAYRDQSAPALWLAAISSLLVLTLRPHLFPLLAVAETLLLAVYWRPRRRRTRLAVFIALGLIATAGVLAAEHLPRAPHLLSARSQPLNFVTQMLIHGPGRYREQGNALLAALPAPIALMTGLMYLLLAVSGWTIFAYFIGCGLLARAGMLATERWFPIAAIAGFMLVVVLLPPNEVGTPYDVLYSQFVLLYAILAIWSGSFAALLALQYLGSRATAAIVASACALAPVPFVLSKTVHSSMLPWAGPYVGVTLPRDLIDGAAFLRTRVDPSQIVMVATNFHCGPLFALSERNLFFAQACDRRSQSPETTMGDLPPLPASTQRRLLEAGNPEAFRTIAREVGIDWFFVHSVAPPPRWIGENAAWHQGTVFILDAGRKTE